MHRSLPLLICILAAVALSGCATGLRRANSSAQTAAANVGGEMAAATDGEPRDDGAVAADADDEEEGEDALVGPRAPLTEGPVTSNDLNDSGADMAGVPHEVNRLVLQWVDYFQGRGRKHMERYLSRSGKYLPMMKEILRKEGLPEDLVYIALIESGFSAHAQSSANAVGYWQFIRGTGRRYGLRVDTFVDERRDFEKATLAAADYLKGLYSLFGSWYLAIASYNVGEGKIMRLAMKHHTRDFWALATKRRLPHETINYVPKYLAARMIAKEPEKYGFVDIEYLKPIAFDTIEVQHAVDLNKMASALGMDYEELRALNPAYKRGIALESGGKLILRIPKGTQAKSELAAATAIVIPGRALAAVGGRLDDEYTFYKIRRGDTLSTIARKFRTTIAKLRKLNNLGRSTRLVAGKKIKVPGETLAGISKREVRTETAKVKQRQAVSRAVVRQPASVVHVVRRGDTLADIARKYRVSLSQLASHNKISRKSKINIGRKIQIP